MIKRTLYFTNPARLSTLNEQLIVKTGSMAEGREEERQIPIEDIGIIVLEHPQITITHVLIDKLLQNNTAIVTCNNKFMPAGLILPFEGNTLLSDRYKDQIEASEPLKKNLWQQTVQTKIRNQAAVLEKHGLENKSMKIWANEVTSGDTQNHEGIAARYYWDHIFSGITVAFKRHRKGEQPNNALNFTYAILRSIIARALTGSGLLPALGIHHRNKYNAYSLADDIMEPYRPFADDIILELMKKDTDITELSIPVKQRLLGIATTDVIIDRERSPLMVAAQKTTASLVKCYAGEQRKIIYPQIPG